MSILTTLLNKIIQQEENPPLIGFIDNATISRSISRYSFVAGFVRGLTLDIGCGSCYGTSIIRRIADAQVIGVDINADLLHYGKFVYDVEDLVVADIRFLPFRQNLFDYIVCLELIEHLSEKDQYRGLSELYTICKKGGSLFISTPNKLWFSPLGKALYPAHVRELRLADLIDILRKSDLRLHTIYGMGKNKGLISYLMNIFKYLLRLIIPKRIMDIFDRILSFKGTEDFDPSPTIPIRKISRDFWRFKRFIVQAIK